MPYKKVSGIYEIVNLSNGHRYIGSAVNIKTRWAVHRNLLMNGKHHSAHLQRAWNKYGASSFEFRVIEYCFVFVLIFREQHYIDTLHPEYNIAQKAGHTLGVKNSPETRAKISANNKNRSPEVKSLFTMAGKKHSEETKKRMSETRKGIKQPIETILKRAAALTGLKRSEEARARMSASHKGKALTDEHRAKLSAVHQGIKRGKYSSNKSGNYGIYSRKGSSKFSVSIRVNKKLIHVGNFDCIEDAVSARDEFENKLRSQSSK